MRGLLTWIAIAALCCSACGYALSGRGNTLPTTIVTIGIPLFVNHSSTPDVDRVLTEAVRTEWRGKGKYRIQPDENGVDAVLHGVVSSVTLQPTTFNTNGQVSSTAVILTASIEFKEVATDKVLWTNPVMQARTEYQVGGGNSPNDATVLFTQDQTALTKLSQTFARSVVTSIFEAF